MSRAPSSSIVGFGLGNVSVGLT